MKMQAVKKKFSRRGFLALLGLSVSGVLAGCAAKAAPVQEDLPSADAVAAEEQELRSHVVAVDAGHGGIDTGAIGVCDESEITARTAAGLTALLAADARFVPVATRPSYDTYAKPAERVAEANAQGAELLLSIHCNADTTGKTHGFECYPMTPGWPTHEESLRFALGIAAGMEAIGHSLRGENGVRYIYYDENLKQSWAECSEDDVRLDKTTFTILEKANCPAVLAEQCFVTSRTDVDAFGSADGAARCARVYYEAVCGFFGETPLGAE